MTSKLTKKDFGTSWPSALVDFSLSLPGNLWDFSAGIMCCRDVLHRSGKHQALSRDVMDLSGRPMRIVNLRSDFAFSYFSASSKHFVT